jgi:hypothetical protein
MHGIIHAVYLISPPRRMPPSNVLRFAIAVKTISIPTASSEHQGGALLQEKHIREFVVALIRGMISTVSLPSSAPMTNRTIPQGTRELDTLLARLPANASLPGLDGNTSL